MGVYRYEHGHVIARGPSYCKYAVFSVKGIPSIKITWSRHALPCVITGIPVLGKTVHALNREPGAWCKPLSQWQHSFQMKAVLPLAEGFATASCRGGNTAFHDDVIKWKPFPRHRPFVRGIHRSPMNSRHKGQWRGALMFSVFCSWMNGWINIREVGDLRRHHAHYDVTYLGIIVLVFQVSCNEANGLYSLVSLWGHMEVGLLRRIRLLAARGHLLLPVEGTVRMVHLGELQQVGPSVHRELPQVRIGQLSAMITTGVMPTIGFLGPAVVMIRSFHE